MSVTTLIVDDTNLASEIIQYHLEGVGCAVVGVARNASGGLKLFRQFKPRLVTLDLMMRKIEEIDSMMMLRAVKDEAPETVVIVVTVIPFQKTHDIFDQAGILAYIVKPFNQYSFEPARLKLMRIFPELAVAT
jgi:two-component system, chemotaxis family, chemotaxis protein CheY